MIATAFQSAVIKENHQRNQNAGDQNAELLLADLAVGQQQQHGV